MKVEVDVPAPSAYLHPQFVLFLLEHPLAHDEHAQPQLGVAVQLLLRPNLTPL